MKVSDLVSFHTEHFFEGAVQLRWVDERPVQAQRAAEAFVFHGPRYHGAADAESDGINGGYKLKDSASFVRDLLGSIYSGLQGTEVNPYWLVVAGYGSGKSHLALTCASLLGNPHSVTAEKIIANITQCDAEIGNQIQADVTQLVKPVLVLTLDGMAGFHLGNVLSQAALAQLHRYGVDTGAIRALSPRFQSAEHFVERNFAFRAESFATRLPNLSVTEICERLRENDEDIYSAVDTLYSEANGTPIPVMGQESAQELINTLCEVYCGETGAFSSVVILFDEFGRYLEYAAEKPLLAGDVALQQMFQGVQDNSNKVRFIGFIQYELKAYLKRFGSADLRQLQRYITRFDSAQKWYLSTNLETIFAHMISKNSVELTQIWQQTNVEQQCQESWRQMSNALPSYNRFPVWTDTERFSRVIAQGCWPLHPLATWFLTRQRDVVQSRSALTFIKEIVEKISSEEILKDGQLRQVSASELILTGMLPQMIAAEHETGSTVAETLQLLLEKFQTHLTDDQRHVLAGVAILEKMRIGKQNQENMNRLLCQATALTPNSLLIALKPLSQELGTIEWNSDLGQYELIADATTRGQFQQWLRKQQGKIDSEAIRELFVNRGAVDTELGDITTDFAKRYDISTPEWYFEAQFSHTHILENIIRRVFQEWEQAVLPTEAKGKVIYLYIHSDEDVTQIQTTINQVFLTELAKHGYKSAPIWVIGISDQDDKLAEHIGRLHLFEQMNAEDRERFRRFVPEERERSKSALKEASQEAIKNRLFWIAGISEIFDGRLKQVGEAIFAQIYPKALPFPFDGFASTNGTGAKDTCQLTRQLIIHQVDGNWIQAQPKQMQNRTMLILVDKWKVLSESGKLTVPQNSDIKAVLNWLEQRHQNDATHTLGQSFKFLIAPPYGMNSASAGLMLGLVIGGISPPRRIVRQGEMIASSDWLNAAFPAANKGKNFLEKSILEQSTLKFLSEDSEGRWRSLLDRWEIEENYQTIVEIANEAFNTKKVDPLPENLEGNYKYLSDRAHGISLLLEKTKVEFKQWEIAIEKAESQDSVDFLLKTGRSVIKKKQSMEHEGCWSETFIQNCDNMLVIIQQILSRLINNWIPRQSCNSALQVSDFRHRMEKAVESLNLLGFKTQAKTLEVQYQHSISHIEARQQFSLTLAESDDYPRQSEPTTSTRVRELRDTIAKGNSLIESVKKASQVLTPTEITARIQAIEKHQSRLRDVEKQQKNLLGNLFSLCFENEQSLHEALTKAKRLRDIFSGTSDETEVAEIITQLEKIIADVSTWEKGDISPERLEELLTQQIEQQIDGLNSFFESEEIEPAWDVKAIYDALARRRIDAVLKCSTDWLAARTQLIEQISSLDLNRCIALEKELMAAPEYLSDDGRNKLETYLLAIRTRHAELSEDLRRSKIDDWQKQFFSLENIQKLSKYEAEQFLKLLNNPPAELTATEQKALQPIETQIILYLDQISIDEIISRIERLPVDAQRQLIKIVTERLVA
jgi:7,8-dihydro-6-hydroxymethylpterin-pyrophosphokinase